jgi:hypothetical protein
VWTSYATSALATPASRRKEGAKLSLLEVDIRYNEFVFCIL